MLRNSKGQGLIEYIIIVAIMAVASLAVVRVMGQSIKVLYTKTSYRLQGKTERAAQVEQPEIRESDYKKSDFNDFFRE